ncbi:receptor-like serine/threonine-protein kinase SD1-8 [Camellia sinensis]|uniref:receptor-like serine/threonine-protein kinase SD1-8 n=1 Tax=Camellia sinensis TaxID=4442 RepID=UPI0010366BB3|nr:receptor-like serine/threonine-protein kinase SD1-8 [Camellia sinensis]
MACYFLLNIMIILSSSLFPVCASEDILRAGESLNSNQTLTSAGGNFALGFFSPGNSTNRYIGIWYKTISKQTVIWVANSENPLAQNSTAVFRLGDDGNLVIFYGRGQDTNLKVLPLFLSFVEEGDEIYLSCSVPGSSNKIRAMLTPSGQAQVLLCEQSDNSWVVAWKLPVVESKCDFYGQCAPFSSCEQNGLHPFCSCLQGFEPKDQNSLNLGNWTGGCARKMALTCDLGDWFFKFERTKLPDYSISLGNMTVSQCESKCRDNCSCTAYAYANMSGETTVHCMNWFGDLMDLKGNDYHGKDLYKHRSKSLIVIAAVAISAGLLLISSFGYVLRMRRLRSQETIDGDSHELDANSSASVAGPSNGELLSFSLRSILAATDNFSEVKQLGEGGYGPVYKGNLPVVQEVAIKKLSKKSLQGTEEFMNELKLIAKLQHQNLVRLLGCCVEQEEKILIYEYMCNGSLDKLLFCTALPFFCPSKQANLDWSKQFRIIEGIAQGLIYLHKYSRLKVIHRDLKASNILLDEAMNPKISDFGTAMSFGINQTEANTMRVVGTYFVVLMLEIMSCKRNTSFHLIELSLTFLGWAWENWKEGSCLKFIDPSIRETCDIQEALKCIAVGLLCVQEFPRDQPTRYIAILMRSNENVSIPSPKEPAFSTCRSSNTVSYPSQTSSSYSNNEVTITMPDAR